MEGGPLPAGVSQLEDTDSEYVPNEQEEHEYDHAVDDPIIPDEASETNFRQQLLKLQQRYDRKDKSGDKGRSNNLGSTRSERRLLLDEPKAISSDESDCEGPSVAYGFPAGAKQKPVGAVKATRQMPSYSAATKVVQPSFGSFVGQRDDDDICDIDDSDIDDGSSQHRGDSSKQTSV